MCSAFAWRWVFTGTAAAFLTHVIIAAGSLLSMLSLRPAEADVAALFLIGAVLIWREGFEDEEDEQADVAPSPIPPVSGDSPQEFRLALVA